MQEQGLETISPTYMTNELVETVTQKIVPISTFIGGFPFASSGFNDGTGYYLGKDKNGGLVILDTWLRGGDRTNSNMVITGIAGVGKSTTVKHIMLSEYMKGTKIVCVDPESEYKYMCKKLNGDWINAGGSENSIINPLQIRPAPMDLDEEENQNLRLYDSVKNQDNGISDMALHIKNLEIFFQLYIPSLNDMQKLF